MYTKKEWEANHITPFYHNVEQEAKPIFEAGMFTQFGLHFIKTGIIEDRLGAFLTRMEQLRENGDFVDFLVFFIIFH